MDERKIKKEAWEITKNNFGTLWLALGINLLISLIYVLGVNYVLKEINENVLTIISFSYNIITMPFSFGLTKYLLDVANKQKPALKDLIYYYTHNVLEVIVLAMILSILYSLGLSLYLIPAVIFFIWFSMSQNIFILKKCNPLDALTESYILIKGYRWNYFNFLLSFLPWLALGIITCGLAFIWVMPYFMISQKVYYYQLDKIKNPVKKTSAKKKKEK